MQDTLRGRVDKDNPTEVKGEYDFPPTSHVNLNLSYGRLWGLDFFLIVAIHDGDP